MGQGNKKRKPGRYANGGLKTTAKRWMQTEKAKRIRRNADNLRNALNRKGITQPPGTEAGHNVNGSGKNGWESVATNRAVETKNKNKLKRYTT